MSSKKAHWPHGRLQKTLAEAVRVAMFADGVEAVARVMGVLAGAFHPNEPARLPTEDSRHHLETIRRLVTLDRGEVMAARAERLSLSERGELKTALVALHTFVERDFGREEAHVPYN